MNKITLLKPPTDLEFSRGNTFKIFFAGSIEMGKARNWQTELYNTLNDRVENKERFVIFDPRRDDWDSSWEQSPNDENFSGQVYWELSNIDESDLVVFYFDENTMSPITLMELGWCLGKQKRIIVYCPKEYFRYGNVHITMKMNNVIESLYEDEEDFENNLIDIMNVVG